MSKSLPTTLVEAIRYFADEDIACEYVAKLRWADGDPVCPRCESTRSSFLATRRVWKCLDCKKQYSVKVGTIFEDSPIKLGLWLSAIWMVANSKNGISSYEMARHLGISQKSAWFMDHRIRLAMQLGSLDKFDGDTEVDETYVGGSRRNMHKAKKARIPAVGFGGKTPVLGALQRSTEGRPSQVRATVAANVKKATLQDFVRTNVKRGTFLASDEHTGYTGLETLYNHQTVNHAERYVSGKIYTNGIENFWALLKRGIVGTYVQVSPEHLMRYVDERVFTFNERHLTDLGRFTTVLGRVSGRRLTWNQLTAKP